VICDKRSSSNSASEGILHELEAIYLCLVEIVEERVTVVKFKMDYESGGQGALLEHCHENENGFG
jgi:hypothetical protein